MLRYFELDVDGQTKRIRAQTVGGSLWFHVDGKTYAVETNTRRSATQSKAAGDGTVTAPMPGKILKLACQVGQQVKKGQLLVAMEAMKMEYSFNADFDGQVESIGCKEGEQVSVSQMLVKVRQEK